MCSLLVAEALRGLALIELPPPAQVEIGNDFESHTSVAVKQVLRGSTIQTLGEGRRRIVVDLPDGGADRGKDQRKSGGRSGYWNPPQGSGREAQSSPGTRLGRFHPKTFGRRLGF